MAEASTQSAPLDIDALLAKGKPADGYGPASEAPLDIDAILAKGKQAESSQQSEPLDIDALIAKGDEYRKNKLLATAPAPETQSLFARMAGKAPKTTSDQSVAGGGGPVLPPITNPPTAPAQIQPAEQHGIMDAVSKGVTSVFQKPISGLGTVRWAADLLDKATDTNMQKAGVDAFIKAVVPFNLYKPDALPAPRNVAEERINKISDTAGTMAGTAASFLIPGKVVTFGLSKIPGAIKAVESLAKFPILQKVVSGVMHNVPTFALRDQVYNDIATGPQERWDIAKDSAKSGVMFGALPALEKLGKAGVALEPLAVFGIGYGGDFGKQDLSTTDRIVSGLSLLLMHYGGKANNMVTAKEKAVKVLEAQGFNPEQAIAITDKVAETVAPSKPTEPTSALEQQRTVNIPETQAQEPTITIRHYTTRGKYDPNKERVTSFFDVTNELKTGESPESNDWSTKATDVFETTVPASKIYQGGNERIDNLIAQSPDFQADTASQPRKNWTAIDRQIAQELEAGGFIGFKYPSTSNLANEVVVFDRRRLGKPETQAKVAPTEQVAEQPADLPTLRENAKAMGLPTEGTAKGVADRIQERMDGEKAAAGDVETIVKKSERDPDKRQFPQRVAEQNPEMTESINSLDLSYAKLKDKDAIDQARREIDADPAKAEAEIGNAKDPLAFTKAVILIDEAAAKGDVDKVVRLVNEFMPQTTNVAQALQKLSVLGRTTPAGMLKYLGRQVSDAAKKMGKSKPVESDVTKAITESEVESAGPAIAAAMAKRTSDGKATEPVWPQYKKEVAEETFAKIDAAINPKTGKPNTALSDFVERLKQNIFGSMDLPASSPSKQLGKIGQAQRMLREVLDNPDKYKQAVDEARAFVREKYAGDPEALSIAEQIMEPVLRQSIPASRIPGITSEAMRDMSMDANKLSVAPPVEQAKARQSFIDYVMGRMDTHPSDAAWMTEQLGQRFDQLLFESLKRKVTAKPQTAETGQRASEISAWQQYKNAIAEQTANRIEAKLSGPVAAQTPALQEFVNRISSVIGEKMASPKSKAGKVSEIERTRAVLQELARNPEKYAEVLSEARAAARKRFAGDSSALSEIDKIMAEIARPGLAEGRVTKITKEGMKELSVSIGDLIKKPYASAQEAKQALVNHIMDRLGTTVEESTVIAEQIRANINQMSKQAKINRLNSILKPKTDKHKAEIDKLSELANMSERAPAEITELVDKALDVVVGVEGRLNRADKTAILEFMRAAQKAKSEGNGREHDLNVMRAMAVATQKMPADRLAQISTVQILSQLLNVKTVGRNLYGNTLFAGAENVSKAMAAAFDVLISKVTGQRTTSLPNLKAQKTGLIRGAKEAFQEVMEGLSRPGTEGKFDLQTAHQFKGKFMQALEKGLGLTLRVPDRAFFESAYSDSLARQMKAAKATKATPEMIERAIYDGEYATFQDNNYASTFFSGLKSLLNGGKKFGIGDLVIKYPKTPGSLIAKGVDYSPVGIAKGLFDLAKPLIGKQMNQYSAALSLGRGVVGTSVILGFYALAKAGIATGIGDEDKKAAALGRATGTGRYKLNLSALKRWVLGGFTKEAARRQDGDMIASYDWALPLSIPASMGASSGEKTATGKDVLGGVVNAIESGTDTLAQQPLITGVRRFAAGSRGPTESSLDAVMETLASAPASFVPTVLSQLRQYTDPTIRDVKDDSIVKTGVNMVANKLPGFSRLVKPKIDVFGEDVKIDNPSVWNIFANPAITSELKNYPGAEMILNLFDRSGGYSAAFPRVIDPKEITWRGKILPLTIGEQIEVKRLIGKDVLERLNEKADNYTGDEDPIRFSDNIAQYILNPARTRAVNAVVSGIDADEKDRRIEKHKEEKKR